ncbi:MAG: YigZ family protein [Bacteroidetes bacterium]|nr:YigZ family protein [Bacteroidota bacterium]
MDEILTYQTIECPTGGDFRDRGSKFLSFAYPINDIKNAKEHIANLKKEHPKAVHHCFAYRIGTDGLSFRTSDDGEPSGTAGKPILGQIDRCKLTNILVVVVRYFGGTLLGVPGLINAYKTASALALDQAKIIEKQVEQSVHLSFDYPAMSEVLYHLRQASATILHQELQLFCEIEANIPKSTFAGCIEKLGKIRNLTWKPCH